MADEIPLFELNGEIDRERHATIFAARDRVQIRDFLTEQTADAIHDILKHQTPWGNSWQGGDEGPEMLRAHELRELSQDRLRRISSAIEGAMRSDGYAFSYQSYPLVQAYIEKWNPGSPHDLLLEYINAPEMLDFIREVTGIPEIMKGDGQATFYGPGHFLSWHTDGIAAEHRRVAYVMNFCQADWRPDWGGYLLFYDEEGDVVAGFKPRYNALNLFRVPQGHSVSMVVPFAPLERFAITGWFRDG